MNVCKYCEHISVTKKRCVLTEKINAQGLCPLKQGMLVDDDELSIGGTGINE